MIIIKKIQKLINDFHQIFLVMKNYLKMLDLD